MAPPAVAIYVTSLTSQPKVRQQTELLRRALRALEIPYTEHDCFADEEAKIRWQRAKPPGRIIGLPGYTVGGEFIGTVDEFEDANETGTLPSFLRQDTDLAGNTSIGEAELEKLMREMTADDLDALAAQIGKESGSGSGEAGLGKVGLMNPEGSETLDAARQAEGSMTIGGQDSASAAANGRNLGVGQGQDVSPVAALAGAAAQTSTAVQETLGTVKDKAADVLASVSGTDKSTDQSSGAAAAALDSVLGSPAKETTEPENKLLSPNSADAKNGKTADRRMSKEDIAAEMRSADTVDGLLESLGRASGEGRDKEKLD